MLDARALGNASTRENRHSLGDETLHVGGMGAPWVAVDERLRSRRCTFALPGSRQGLDRECFTLFEQDAFAEPLPCLFE